MPDTEEPLVLHPGATEFCTYLYICIYTIYIKKQTSAFKIIKVSNNITSVTSKFTKTLTIQLGLLGRGAGSISRCCTELLEECPFNGANLNSVT